MDRTDLFKPNVLKQLCEQYSLRPTQKYGQNYLISSAVIDSIIEAANLDPEDNIIEVGPGFGVLTLALSEKVKKVTAFEIEKKLVEYWEELLKEEDNVEIVWGNVLCQEMDVKKSKVVANLPYQITSAVIRKFLSGDSIAQLMIFMVQKEVAMRICARAGDMSVLSISIQLFCKASIVEKVTKTKFWPVPAVDSAIIKLEKKKDIPEIDQDKFFKLVKSGFSSKRKKLLNNLLVLFGKDKKEQILVYLDVLKIPKNVRAQDLDVNQWLLLLDAVEKDDKLAL